VNLERGRRKNSGGGRDFTTLPVESRKKRKGTRVGGYFGKIKGNPEFKPSSYWKA